MATAGAVSLAAERGGALEGGRLAQRLGEIEANAMPEDMLEPALRAIVAESGAAAGALCLFDSRQELLRLIAEVGLSDAGCQQLRCVRRGNAGGWDIPLHGLTNRRAYLIDSAARNRYVPPLVEPATSMRAVICVPVYSGPTPLGSLILVAVAPRSFGERDIHALEAPLGALVRMIEATRRRGGAQAPRVASAAPTPPPAASPDGQADADRVQLLIASLAATERERSRLEAALEAGTEDRTERARLQAALDASGAERGAEVQRLTAQFETERVRLQAALDASISERGVEAQRLTERLETERARLQAALEASIAERSAEVARLTEQLDAERARFNAALEESSTQHDAEVQRLGEQVEAERARLKAALDTSSTERDAEIQRLTQELDTQRVHLQKALETSTADVQRLTEQLDAERARFKAAFEGSNTEHGAEVRRLTQDSDTQRLRLQEALETSSAEVERLAEQLEAERARFKAALEESSAKHGAEVQRLTEQLEAERAPVQAALAASSAERDTEVQSLTEQLDAALAREADATRRVAELDRALAELRRQRVDDPPPTPQAESAPEPDVAPVTPVAVVAPHENVVAVVDAGSTWPSVGPGGEQVTLLSPADVALRLNELAPGRVLANLAAPGALEALAALRSAGWTTPVRGCLGATAHAVPLGAVEAIQRPLDSDAIQRALGPHAGRGSRVLIIGTDVDFFVALREALGRGGMSVSMAWDAHQVDDLLAMVRPDVALIDLALGSRDVRPIVARLAALDPVPTMALILGSTPAAKDLAAVMTFPVVAARAMPLDGLLANTLTAAGSR